MYVLNPDAPVFLPRPLATLAGAPQTVWVVLHSPSDSPALHVTLVWQNKTPTRLPEALWLRFKPGRGAVDDDSWTMNKISSSIKPTEVSTGVLLKSTL